MLLSILKFYAVLKVKESEVAQLCLTLCDPMDFSLPGSSIHGIFQARVLEWVASAFSKEGRGYTKTSLNSSTHLEVARPGKAFQLYVHEREGVLGSVNSKVGT